MTIAFTRPFSVDYAGYKHAFFPADGSAGLVVGNLWLLAPRPHGFFRTLPEFRSDTSQWVFGVEPDGTDEGLLRSDSDPDCKDFLYAHYRLTPDPRGGYVETRIHSQFAGSQILRILEVRWVDADLTPRTRWFAGTTWDYSYNMYVDVYVDLSGSALVTLWFDPPMSMPCPGAITRALWASEEGSIQVFTPVTPTVHSEMCDDPNFAGFGNGVVLQEGGVAFYMPPGSGKYAPSVSGWYARYPVGSGIPTAAPEWLKDYNGSLTLLARGGAYLATSSDPLSCSRTAEIVGPAGQLCATLPLEGSDGCNDWWKIWPDGTLVLRGTDSALVRWWPHLARAH